MRGIRGAICAEDNARDSIYRATQSLLRELVERNRLQTNQIVAAFFTMTPDLDADFPAYAARDMGWDRVPMLGAQESLVPGAPERAIRVLVLAEGEGEPRAVYLGRAAAMRPDLAEPGDERWTAGGPAPRHGPSSGKGELLVVGLGLIGGSVAAGARRSGLFERVLGHDRDGAAAELALARGLVDEVAADLQVAAGRADMVVLATPVSVIVRLLGQLGAYLKPGTIVTDVGSTKRRIVQSMANLPVGVAAVGGHPMAGSTTGGAAAADSELFRGARWALVASARSEAGGVRETEALVAALGAQPVWLDAEEHDRIVSVTSHLAAAVAVGLVQTVAASGLSARDAELLIGPGFRSTSRLAAGDPEMTADMLTDNADYLGRAIDTFISPLQELARSAAGDRSALREQLARVRELRRSLMRGAAD
ncbi:MAG: chorismate mutase [Gemmatimonadales bacterium]|jgi:prephenate dehydrogenase